MSGGGKMKNLMIEKGLSDMEHVIDIQKKILLLLARYNTELAEIKKELIYITERQGA
jgi:hypothetical protein